MRKLIFLIMLFVLIIETSCSKEETIDYSNPDNIEGTTWKCTLFPAISQDIEYALLVFTTTTEVEGWTKEIDAAKQKDWTGTYTISNDTISILYEEMSIVATITDETISMLIDETLIKFILQ